MTDAERALQKAELRGILMSVPLKAIISGLFIHFTMSSSDMDIFGKIFLFITMYSMMSIYIFISKRVGNWLIGLFGMIGLLVATVFLDIPDAVSTILGLLLIFGGFTLDITRIVRYIRLCRKPHDETVEINVIQSPSDDDTDDF